MIITKEDILEGNKLLAEFKGYKYYLITEVEDTYHAGWKLTKNAHSLDKYDTTAGNGPFKRYLTRSHNGLRFYNSYDWLMPIYLEIKNNHEYGCQLFCISTDYIEVIINDLNLGKSVITKYYYKDFYSELTALWFAIVEFIKWYNNWNNLR
jgi:hypothetical protein